MVEGMYYFREERYQNIYEFLRWDLVMYWLRMLLFKIDYSRLKCGVILKLYITPIMCMHSRT